MIKEQNFMEENFEQVGSNERVLLQSLKFLSEKTKIRTIDPTQLTLYSIVHIGKDGMEVMVIQPDYMDVEELFPLYKENTYFSKGNKHFGFFSYERFKKHMGMTDQILEEVKETGYFLRYSRKIGDSILLIPSKQFFTSLYRQLGCQKLPDIEDPFLHIFTAYLLRDGEPFKMIYREGELIGKAFTCFSTNYSEKPQYEAAVEFLNEMKPDVEGLVSYYKITHFVTQIRFSIPELYLMLGNKKVEAGVELIMSDTGDASITIQSVLSVNGRHIRIGEAVNQPHKGDIDLAVLVRKYKAKELEKLKQLVGNLKKIKSETVSKKRTVTDLLDIIRFSDVAGNKVAKLYYANLEDAEISLQECVAEVLAIPGSIENFYRQESLKAAMQRNDERKKGLRSGQYEEEVGKDLPESVLIKTESAIGSLFTSEKARKLLYGNKQD